jgi:hypothetical protein
MEPMKLSKEDIANIARSRQLATVWLTSKGAILYVPPSDIWTAPGVDPSAFEDGRFVVVRGVKGLAAVDRRMERRGSGNLRSWEVMERRLAEARTNLERGTVLPGANP